MSPEQAIEIDSIKNCTSSLARAPVCFQKGKTMPYSHPSQDPAIQQAVREARAAQKEEIARQNKAEKRERAKAARRNKYKQSPDDPILVWAWKEIMR